MLKKIAVAAVAGSLAIALTVALFPSQAQIVTAYLLRTNNGSDILSPSTFRSNLGAAGNGAVTGSGLTMASARLLGRTTASTGAVEEITVGTGLSLSSGNLSATGGGVGTVTSVAQTVPTSIMSISGSPITSSGTLALSLATQTANLVWAGPSTGSAATPTFRSIVFADLPYIPASATNGGTITAAATTDLSLSANNVQTISGNTGVTSFGTGANLDRTIIFTGSPIVTYNGTSLITPTLTDIQAAPGDVMRLISDGSGNWTIIGYTPSGGVVASTCSGVTTGTSGGECTSISLSPGHWRITADMFGIAGIGGTSFDLAISDTSGTIGPQGSGTSNHFAMDTPGGYGGGALSGDDVTLTTTTIYYLNSRSNVAGGLAYGRIRAEREF